MAAADVSDRWTVVIDCDDEEKARILKLTSDIEVHEVKDMWCEMVGVSSDSVMLAKMDGTTVASNLTLAEVGESFPGRRNINFIAETVANVDVELYRIDSFRVKMVVRLSEPPEQLEAEIQREFNIPSDRQFRLRTHENPLSPGVGLGAQGVTAGSLFQVELLYDVAVKEAWSGRVDHYLVFGSDACTLLEEANGADRQRVNCDKHVVDTGLEVVEALRPFGGLAQLSFSLQRELRQEVVVAVSGLLKPRKVWPGDRVETLIPAGARASVQPGVVFDGRQVPWAARLSSVDLPASGLLHCAPISLRVRTSNGKVHAVRVPGLGAVSDVKEAVRAKETATHFVLQLRGRVLEEEESLVGAGVSSGDLLKVEPTDLALKVTLCDRAVRWRTHRRSFRFSELMEEVSRWGSVEYEQLLERTLCCVGCRRRVRRSEEAFQTVPAPCCRVRSLELEEPTARDCETQTATLSRRRESRSVDKRQESVDRGAEAVAFWHQAGTKTEVESRDHATQAVAFWHQVGTQTEDMSPAMATTGVQTAAPERIFFAQQHPLKAPQRPTPFLIQLRSEGRWQQVHCDFVLEERPTVGQIRAAVVCELALKSGVRLERFLGRKEGREVFLVCNKSGELGGLWEVGDEGGGVWRTGDAQGWQCQVLADDADSFPVAPVRRNVVYAYPL